jgi:hypothetical protein
MFEKDTGYINQWKAKRTAVTAAPVLQTPPAILGN